MIIAWGSNLFGLGLGGLSLKGVGDAFASFGFSVPIPAVGHIFSGFEFLGVILVTAIPFGIYDLVEAMDNVESAEAAGDAYPTTRVLTADGVVSLIGCLMGNPFINAVYIGHPGWKAMGGRIGYSAATGIMVVLLSWFGIISVLLALVPVVAISPILLYIGMLIGAQAFQTTPVKHAPAIVLALTPHLAAWAKLQIDTMLGSTLDAAQKVGGLAADKVGDVKTAAIASLPQQGVLYRGLEVMGGGSILAGLVLGAIGVFVIEREFVKASAFALSGAVLTYFGFMHGEAVGIGGGLGVTPGVALAYAVVAAGFFAVEKFGISTAFRFDPGDASCRTRRMTTRHRSGPCVTETVAAIVAAHRAGHVSPAQTVARSFPADSRSQRSRHLHQPARRERSDGGSGSPDRRRTRRSFRSTAFRSR